MQRLDCLHRHGVLCLESVPMIAGFADPTTEALFHGEPSRALRRWPPGLASLAARKLDMPEAATTLRDLLKPPGNRLHPLWGDLQGHYAIRVNDQWRIVFRWMDGDAHDVRLTDCH
jgi:toxin HigB-1